MLKKERICDCERNQVNENNVIININEDIKDVNEYLLVKDLLTKSEKLLDSFEKNIYNTKEFKVELLDWIKENIYLAGIISIAYYNGVYNLASNSDNEGFEWLINVIDNIYIPKTKIKLNLHELDDDFTSNLVGKQHYFYSKLLNKDFFIVDRETSSNYKGENFIETCFLPNHLLPRLIYETLLKNKEELEKLYA